VVARAEGRLVPQTRIKIVQPAEGGRIAGIQVAEGDQVKADQVLVVMDPQLSQADTEKLRLELALTELQLRRVEAELADVPFQRRPGDDDSHYQQVLAQYRQHREAHQREVALGQASLDRLRDELAASRSIYSKVETALPIYRASEAAYEELGRSGYSGKLAVLDQERRRIEAERDLQSQAYTLRSLQAQIREAEERLAAVHAEYRRALIDEQVRLEQDRVRLRQDWRKQTYRNTLLELKAPQDGIVKDLATHTEGSVVPSGSVLMTLVPLGDPLKAEVFVAQRDVGFVRRGQSARVKFVSYEFQRYGTVEGEVEHVGADANDSTREGMGERSGSGVPSGYRALLTLERQFVEREGRRFDLRPGMSVVAEIRLGERSVIEYLLSPVRKTLDEAGRER
jgi:hemolysin D